MAEHFQSFSAVIPIFYRDGKILLQLRQNTGHYDGYWDFAGSGHMEQGETATQALIRECHEELGLDLSEQAPVMKHVSQLVFPEKTYFYFYFTVNEFQGEPSRLEPDKSAQLAWFPLERLPEQMMPVHQDNLDHIFSGEFYSEIQQY